MSFYFRKKTIIMKTYMEAILSREFRDVRFIEWWATSIMFVLFGILAVVCLFIGFWRFLTFVLLAFIMSYLEYNHQELNSKPKA